MMYLAYHLQRRWNNQKIMLHQLHVQNGAEGCSPVTGLCFPSLNSQAYMAMPGSTGSPITLWMPKWVVRCKWEKWLICCSSLTYPTTLSLLTTQLGTQVASMTHLLFRIPVYINISGSFSGHLSGCGQIWPTLHQLELFCLSKNLHMVPWLITSISLTILSPRLASSPLVH